MSFTTSYASIMGEPLALRKFIDSLHVRVQMENRGVDSVRLVKDQDKHYLTAIGSEEKLFEVTDTEGTYVLVSTQVHASHDRRRG